MTEPLLLRNAFPIACLTVLQVILPPVAAIAMLFLIGELHPDFDLTATPVAIIATLSVTLIQKPPQLNAQLASNRLPAVVSVAVRWLLLLFLFLVLGYITKSLDRLPRGVFLAWAICTPLVLMLITLFMNAWMRRLLMISTAPRAAVMCGCNDASRGLAQRLKDSPESRLAVKGFFDDRSEERLGGPLDGVPLLGKLDELSAYVKSHNIDVIFIALPIRHLKRVMDLLDQLHDTTASIYYVPDVFVFDLIQARSAEILNVPVVAMCETPFYGYRGMTKRLVDVVISGVALLLASPILVVVALLVKLTSAGPIIFKQHRYGLDGREIIVYKFRSMTVTENGPNVQQASKGDRRLTPVGGFLRRTSLDELPQLINVLQGRMSLVGPRPHAVAHNEQYRKLIKGYMIRHKVLPGITGLAQVNGCRGETARLEDMEARVKYDLDYLRRWSPMLDFKIMWQTVLRLFGDEKAY